LGFSGTPAMNDAPCAAAHIARSRGFFESAPLHAVSRPPTGGSARAPHRDFVAVGVAFYAV